MDTTKRFWNKVDLGSGENDCWLRQGWNNGVGYGLIKIDGKAVLAHRYSYELHVGLIGFGKVIDHLCRQPACVNPAHLEAVTQKVNTERAVKPVWERRRKQTHCRHGHELSGLNLYMRKDGKRACKICKNKATRIARAAKFV